MRAGFIISVCGHVAMLGWGVISLPSPKSLDASNIEMVPIDFVTVDQLTRLNLGVTTAEAREEVEPEPPPPAPEPEPEPEPEPPPPPPEPEPEPPPPPPEPEPEPEPPPPPPEEIAEPEPPAPVPLPPVRPTPPKPVVAEAKTEEELLSDKIAAIIDVSEPAAPTPPTLGGATGRSTERMTINELDALKARLIGCWHIQVTPPDPSELRVKMKIFLNQNGSLSQPPIILESGSSSFARTAAESAVRAVRRCAPYNLPPEKYDDWREIIMTFDPREQSNG
jgi:hypothetical protein